MHLVRALGAALAIAAGAAAATTLPATPVAADPPGLRVTNGCFLSVPDPGTTTPVSICYTLFKPRGASGRHQVPMILHSHGWGGSRTTDPAAFRRWLDAGYGVLSFDQRGFGESGGHAYVENPDVEGHDVTALVDLVSRLRWVQQDAPGDPRMGAIGGSYGGGYQFLAAFEELRQQGKPVLDALAPEITWNDLSRSLAPEGVVRTEWAAALAAASVPSRALPIKVYKALVEGATTGSWPDGSIPGTEDMQTFFAKNGPAWQVAQGRRLDIPMLFRQGTTDTLFNLQQGLDNWRTVLTRRARKHSIFIGYNGGHVLPGGLPSRQQRRLGPLQPGAVRRLLRGAVAAVHGRAAQAGEDGPARLRQVPPRDAGRDLYDGRPGHARHRPAGRHGRHPRDRRRRARLPDRGRTRSGSPGPPISPGNLTALGVTNRAFYGLGVGTSPLDATLVQNNVMPLDQPTPVTGQPRRIELPAVAVDVPAGKTLYVIASPISVTFAGTGSRTPGAIVLADTVAHLPVVGR